MTYPSLAVANFFIEKARADGAPLSPMKLQKLVYYAEGWNLAYTGESLIDETIQAWQYGPVIPSLYHEFKHYGNGNIQTPGTTIDFSKGGLHVHAPNIKPSDSFSKELLERVWSVYKNYTAIELSSQTHTEGTPWHSIYVLKGMNSARGLEIPKEVIKTHFSDLRRANEGRAKA